MKCSSNNIASAAVFIAYFAILAACAPAKDSAADQNGSKKKEPAPAWASAGLAALPQAIFDDLGESDPEAYRQISEFMKVMGVYEAKGDEYRMKGIQALEARDISTGSDLIAISGQLPAAAMRFKALADKELMVYVSPKGVGRDGSAKILALSYAGEILSLDDVYDGWTGEARPATRDGVKAVNELFEIYKKEVRPVLDRRLRALAGELGIAPEEIMRAALGG